MHTDSRGGVYLLARIGDSKEGVCLLAWAAVGQESDCWPTRSAAVG